VCLPHASTGDRKSDDSVVLVGCGTAHKVHGIDVKVYLGGELQTKELLSPNLSHPFYLPLDRRS
jgi:hypothetical protein